MPDIEKVIKGMEICYCHTEKCKDCSYHNLELCYDALHLDALTLLKNQEEKIEHLNNIALEYEKEVFRLQALLKGKDNEYENGFNDAILGKQELMYEGIDGKWHKKDW